MGASSGTSKRRRRATAYDGPDLISGLDDDVLLRILGLLDARHAARTDALSRRWRGLWTRVPALRFDSLSWPSIKKASAADRYAAFVDTCLAQRAADQQTAAAAVEHLAISFEMGRPTGIEVERAVSSSIVVAAQRWMRHAAERGVKSLVFKMDLPWYHGLDDTRRRWRTHEAVMVLDDIPSSAKLETMHLEITKACVHLPATAVFASLTELALLYMVLPEGGSHRLSRFVSSECCPHLQKLRLRHITRLKELLVEAGALKELSFESMEEGCYIDLRTPSLQVLQFLNLDGFGNRPHMLRISAPRLEELMFDQLEGPDHIIVDGDFPLLRNLTVFLRSHGCSDKDEYNDVAIRLLQCCTSLTCLEVDLHVTKEESRVDRITGRIPHLPHVTSLTVDVFQMELHSFGYGLEDILANCNNLKYLYVDCRSVCTNQEPESYCTCYHPNYWKTRKLYLTHLHEVEFAGLAGTDCELWFMEFLLTSSTELQKLNVSFHRDHMRKNKRDVFELIRHLGGGVWTTCRDTCWSYEWKPYISGERTE